MSTPKSDSQSKPSRRGFVLGAAAAGAAATAVATLSKSPVPAAPEAAAELPPAPENGGGYRLSEHVKRYYKTTLI
jgi:hypothetical protein